MDKGLKYQGLIAPCGMNCGICIGHLRDRRPCGGCKGRKDVNKPNACRSCSIVNCELLTKTESGFCYACVKYPCTRLKMLDKRYRTNYGMSMIENLELIKNQGLEAFLRIEGSRWKCKKCGSGLSAHRDSCIQCGTDFERRIL